MPDIKIRSPWVASALSMFFFLPLEATGAAARCGCSLGQTCSDGNDHDPEAKEKTARANQLTLFFGPRQPPVCLASRFFVLTSFSRPSLRLPPRFNPFQRGHSLRQWNRVYLEFLAAIRVMQFYNRIAIRARAPNPMMGINRYAGSLTSKVKFSQIYFKRYSFFMLYLYII